jgi:hypothetical protein
MPDDGDRFKEASMKVWAVVTLALIMAGSVEAVSFGDEQVVKDASGKMLAVVVVCSDCRDAKAAKNCHSGVEQGWLDGKACGRCLVDANANARFPYSQELHFAGKLIDDAGQPVQNRFVKLYMANGWSVRTATSDAGTFRLLLGPTEKRTSKSPLVTDLGVRVDLAKSTGPDYAILMLPESYKPCAAPATGPHAPRKKKE